MSLISVTSNIIRFGGKLKTNVLRQIKTKTHCQQTSC